MSQQPAAAGGASVDWVVLCESVTRDDKGRLSLVGIASHLPVPSLPLVLVEHTIVARLGHIERRQALDVSFGMVTPGGCWVAPSDDDAATLEVAGEFVIITLRSLPLRSEGIHRFEVGLGNGSAASVDVPVWLCAPRHEPAQLH